MTIKSDYSAHLQARQNVLRQMSVAGKEVLRERITNDPARGEVLFTLIDHPVYRGQVINRVKATAEGAVLEYALDWVPINGQEPPGGPDMAVAIQGAVLHTKALAEERARGD